MGQLKVLRPLPRASETTWAPPGRVGSPRVQIVALAALAIAGFVGILLATTHGIGLEPDSQAYIAGARSLAQGHGYAYSTPGGGYQPILIWPPVYSLVLSIPGFVGFDAMGCARILAAMVLAANVFMVGWLIRRHPRSGFWPPLVGATLVLASTDMLNVHIRALSEPLFICFTLLGTLCLARAIEKGSLPLLYCAAFVLGVAVTTRVAGLAFVVAGTILVSLEAGRLWRKRVAQTWTFFAVAMLPFLVWGTRNRLVGGSFTGRELGWHPVGTAGWRQIGGSVASWLVPETSPPWLRSVGLTLVVLILVVMVGVFARERQILPDPPLVASFLLVGVVCYFGLYVFVMTFIDASIGFERRTMLPLYVFLMIVVFLTLAHRRFPRVSTWRGVPGILLVGVLAWFGARVVLWFRVVSADAQGIAARRFEASETLAMAKHYLGNTECIYTNNGPAIYFHLGQAAYPVPRTWDAALARGNESFARDTRAMLDCLTHHRGIILWFFDFPTKENASDLRSLQGKVPLECLFRGTDGVILGSHTMILLQGAPQASKEPPG